MEFFFCFLLLSAHLLLASSLVQFQDNGLTPKQVSIHLEVHHGQSQLNHSTTSSLEFFSPKILEKDEQRVEAIRSRFSNKNLSNIKPELVSTPLKSGLSIGSGNYYVKLGVGTPPQYSSLIVDTGSSLSWLQCQPCKGSCHPQVDPLFNPSRSKTFKKFPCSSPSCSSLKESTLNDPGCEVGSGACVYREAYGDSSFSIGYLSQDVLSLTPSETLPGFVYGCGQNNQGLFGKSSGILGLGHDKLSALAQLSTKYGYAFSYCLPTSFSASKPSKGGYLSIGSSSLAKSPFKFTPMVKNPKIPSLYSIDLTAITVAGRPLGIAASSYKVPTIVDSGTVITRLPMPVYTALKEAFVKIMSKKYKPTEGISILDTCFEGRAKEIVNVPEIGMIFQGGAALPLNGHNTLIELDEKTTCLAIAGSSGTNPIAIIGNYQQQTFNVAFDISNSKIGFAPAGCE
ncbi:aspartyl protease family protein At5g10770-like [Neltuma alba]|uniref:aspartyl protease family protein At5g10770-like n=1 Tax=Neltuma alba TaxID=207710 RepID=UPI0010A52C0A|nr:aspartyl protease family protein At5g10770-like [Prosopis alba]XP_028794136.1 aspartyl protease family protein At5g10770-like [Prosopis alba]